MAPSSQPERESNGAFSRSGDRGATIEGKRMEEEEEDEEGHAPAGVS